MKLPALLFLPVALLLGPVSTRVSAQDSRGGQVRFSDAVELSIGNTPQIEGAKFGIDAAERKVSGTAAQRLPKLKAEGNVLRWNDPISIQFGSSTPGSSVAVREQVTTSFSLSLAQPISGLFVLGRMIDIDRRAVGIAKTSMAKTKLDAAHRAAEAYVATLNAQSAADLAKKTVTQLEAQHANAVKLQTAGVLGLVDVLRLVSARDAARLALVRADTTVATARAELAMAIDRPADAAFEIVDEFPEPPPAPTLDESAAHQLAADSRLELKDAALQTEQARANKTVAMAQLLPNIMGVATYQNISGQGPFQPRNAWYIGATLSWEIWDWGKTWDGVKEAEARAGQVAAGEKTVRNQISLQVRQRLLENRAAFATLEPARSSLAAAEEAHRIQSVRFEQGVVSTVDIINSETDLHKARSAYAQARFEYYRAQIALARAAGALPFAQQH
jgi:outer membrane protein TolC